MISLKAIDMEHKSHQQLIEELAYARNLVKVGASYSHFKHSDNLYTVLGLTILEATDEIAVIYKPFHQENISFTRPLTSWLEKVEYKGNSVDRFNLVESLYISERPPLKPQSLYEPSYENQHRN